METCSPLPVLEEDGLALPVVGPWASDKHRKIAYYAKIFSESMKEKWQCRVFIDLFAGAGMAKIKGTGELVPGSPLIALGLDSPFDRYVFCENDPVLYHALKTRIDRYYPDTKAEVLNLDSNARIEEVLKKIPSFGRGFTGLAFCFVDPFNASNLSFETIRRVSSALYVDFIVLLPSYMDIKRNEHIYTKPECRTLDTFLGDSEWRKEWSGGKGRFRDFGVFIADQFGKRMEGLGYLYEGTDEFDIIRMGEDRSLYLYHLCFFSKNKLGKKFWKDARKNTTNQMHLGI